MGFSVQRFIGPIDPNLICSICSAVLEDAVLTTCGHTFCNSCITTWFSRPNTRTCPECRSNVRTEDIKPVLSLRNLIHGLDVECENSARGCKVILKLERLKSHLSTCGYVPIECASCNHVINKVELTAHQIQCEAIANSVKDEEDRGDSSQELRNVRFRNTLTSIDISQLLSKVASLEFHVKTLKRDLQIAESKNRVLERECKRTQVELRQRRYELTELSTEYDPDYEYGYTPQSIAKLSFLIARHLLHKPSFIDRDKIFTAVQRCYDKYARCGSEFEHDVHMLLATAFASNWFTESYRLTLHYWLQNVARYREIVINSAKMAMSLK